MKYLLLILLLNTHFLFAQKLQDEKINECSGLVVSTKSDDLLWVHNDSGDKSRIFLINKEGKTLATYNYNEDVKDCEDIAKATINSENYLFVGDIGDNYAKRESIKIYKFLEPAINQQIANQEIEITKVEELQFRYPDGAKDAECLMVDPIDQKIYVVSKREDSVGVYSASLSVKAGAIITLKKETKLFFPGFSKLKWITGGDISLDGHAVLIKSYSNVFYWKRNGTESLVNCLKRNPEILPYKMEPQGEAIGFTNSGKNYYTISEGKEADIFYHQVK